MHYCLLRSGTTNRQYSILICYLKLLIDKNIPFLKDSVDKYIHSSNPNSPWEVEYLSPEYFTVEKVRDADALIIRTRTRCDAHLLEGSKVRFIATATIGYDHINTQYCTHNNIYWTSCPGCNADAVCEYMAEALDMLDGIDLPPHPTLGIIGVGHVGSRVAEMASKKGFSVLLNDPPKGLGISLDEIAKRCDIITFHTPLTTQEPYPTKYLCDETFLQSCRPNAVIINAARGGIVDEKALLHSQHPCIIDCWENEPDINRTLLLSQHTIGASYHIAGYSIEGKYNASQMCLDAFCKHFGLPALKCQNNFVSLQPQMGDSAPGWLTRITEQLKKNPDKFEILRTQYLLR